MILAGLPDVSFFSFSVDHELAASLMSGDWLEGYWLEQHLVVLRLSQVVSGFPESLWKLTSLPQP